MSHWFHPSAAEEFNAAVDWYEERRIGLGLEFSAEVRRTISHAESMPLAWTPLDGRIRRILVHRFPYGILYASLDSGIHIVAVMHLSRKPDYWKSRLG